MVVKMKRYKAIWGAGFLGGKELLMLGSENIDFFIDANIKKKGTHFSSKPVVYVDEISDWTELYIYIPETYLLSIEPILKSHNFELGTDYELFDGKYKFDFNSLVKDYNRAINDLVEKQADLKNKVLFWGWDFSEKRSYNEYFEKIHAKNTDFEYAVVSENLWSGIEVAEKKNGVPTVMPPNVFCFEAYLVENNKIDDSNESDEEIISKAVEMLRKFCPEITQACAALQVKYMLEYIKKVLELCEPKYIFASGARNVRSMLLEYACKGENKIIYASPGILPGTYTLDPYGETGHSVPNQDSLEFRNKVITDAEFEDSRNIIKELNESGENRKLLQDFDLDSLCFTDDKRPTILFAAQPDTDFTPYDEEVQTYYSPIFKTSREAGVHISKICEKNGWNYIFKSHPMYIHDGIEQELQGNAIHIKQGNINTLIDNVDVVVTIQSSVSYTALIRNKPVVMLGYNQLKEKGCCYEAYTLDNIELMMKKALESKVTDEMEKNFILHIAQIKKYYLYDDLSQKSSPRGKILFESVQEIFGN